MRKVRRSLLVMHPDAESDVGTRQTGSDDLAWLSAIDWGDDQRTASEEAAPASVENTLELAPAVEAGDYTPENTGIGEGEGTESPVVEATEVVVEELVARPPESGESAPAGVPGWMRWVVDDGDPVDPDPVAQAAVGVEPPVVEIDSLLMDERDEVGSQPEVEASPVDERSAEAEEFAEDPSRTAEEPARMARRSGRSSRKSGPYSSAMRRSGSTSPVWSARAYRSWRE
jgi:hypothetical protein